MSEQNTNKPAERTVRNRRRPRLPKAAVQPVAVHAGQAQKPVLAEDSHPELVAQLLGSTGAEAQTAAKAQADAKAPAPARTRRRAPARKKEAAPSAVQPAAEFEHPKGRSDQRSGDRVLPA